MQSTCFINILFNLFKGLRDRPKDGPSSRSPGNFALCCHETGQYTQLPERLKWANSG